METAVFYVLISQIKTYTLCLVKISKDFTNGNMKKQA